MNNIHFIYTKQKSKRLQSCWKCCNNLLLIYVFSKGYKNSYFWIKCIMVVMIKHPHVRIGCTLLVFFAGAMPDEKKSSIFSQKCIIIIHLYIVFSCIWQNILYSIFSCYILKLITKRRKSPLSKCNTFPIIISIIFFCNNRKNSFSACNFSF